MFGQRLVSWARGRKDCNHWRFRNKDSHYWRVADPKHRNLGRVVWVSEATGAERLGRPCWCSGCNQWSGITGVQLDAHPWYYARQGRRWMHPNWVWWAPRTFFSGLYGQGIYQIKAARDFNIQGIRVKPKAPWGTWKSNRWWMNATSTKAAVTLWSLNLGLQMVGGNKFTENLSFSMEHRLTLKWLYISKLLQTPETLSKQRFGDRGNIANRSPKSRLSLWRFSSLSRSASHFSNWCMVSPQL